MAHVNSPSPIAIRPRDPLNENISPAISPPKSPTIIRSSTSTRPLLEKANRGLCLATSPPKTPTKFILSQTSDRRSSLLNGARYPELCYPKADESKSKSEEIRQPTKQEVRERIQEEQYQSTLRIFRTLLSLSRLFWDLLFTLGSVFWSIGFCVKMIGRQIIYHVLLEWSPMPIWRAGWEMWEERAENEAGSGGIEERELLQMVARDIEVENARGYSDPFGKPGDIIEWELDVAEAMVITAQKDQMEREVREDIRKENVTREELRMVDVKKFHADMMLNSKVSPVWYSDMDAFDGQGRGEELQNQLVVRKGVKVCK